MLNDRLLNMLNVDILDVKVLIEYKKFLDVLNIIISVEKVNGLLVHLEKLVT